MSETIVGSDGTLIPLDSLTQVFAYTGTDISTITVAYAGKTFVQTFSYTGGMVTTITGWVKQ